MKRRRVCCWVYTVMSLYGAGFGFGINRDVIPKMCDVLKFPKTRPGQGLMVAVLFAELEVHKHNPQMEKDLITTTAATSTSATSVNLQSNTSQLLLETGQSNSSSHIYEDLQPVKLTITLSTAVLMMATIFYHYNEIQIFKFDNSLSPKSPSFPLTDQV